MHITIESRSTCAAMKNDIKILVLGDDQVGKSSLISSFISDCFTEEVPSVMMDTVLPPSTTVYGVRTTLVDSASSDRDGLRSKLRAADCVIVLYDASRPATLNSVTSLWLPLVRSSIASSSTSASRGLGGSSAIGGPGASPPPLFSPSTRTSPMVMTPQGPAPSSSKSKMAIVAAAKTDLVPGFEMKNDPWITNLLRDFPFVACVTSCSSRNLDVKDLFDLGARLAAFPVAPLMDLAAQTCTSHAERAFRRIFRVYDRDHDGLWSDFELNAFQMSGGWDDLKPDELLLLKQKLARCFDDRSQGVRDNKITFDGFYVLMQQYVKDLRMEVPWKVLRVHNYDDDLRLMLPDLIFEPPSPISVERSTHMLTAGAVDFLTSLVETADPRAVRRREASPPSAPDPEWWTPLLLREPLSVFPETLHHPWRVRRNESGQRPLKAEAPRSPRRSDYFNNQFDGNAYRVHPNMASFGVPRTPSSNMNPIQLISATNSDDAASVGPSDAASVVSNSESVLDYAVTQSGGVIRQMSTESDFYMMSRSYDPVIEKIESSFRMPFDVYEEIDSGFFFYIRSVRDRDADAKECMRDDRVRAAIADWLTEWHMLAVYRPMLVKELLFRLGYVARDCGICTAPSSMRMRCSVRRSLSLVEEDGDGRPASSVGAGRLMDRFNLLSPSRYSSDVYLSNGQHFLPPSTTHLHICVLGGPSVDAAKYALVLSLSKIVSEMTNNLDLSSSYGNLSTDSILSIASEEQGEADPLSDRLERANPHNIITDPIARASEKYGGKSVAELNCAESLCLRGGVNVTGCHLWIDVPPSTRCHWTQPAHLGSPFSTPISLHVVMAAVPSHASASWLRDHGSSVDLALLVFEERDQDGWKALVEIEALLDGHHPVPRQYLCLRQARPDDEGSLETPADSNNSANLASALNRASKEDLRAPLHLGLLADGSVSVQESKNIVEACVQSALDAQERGVPLRLRPSKGLLRWKPLVVIPFVCGLVGLPLAYYFLGEVRTWAQDFLGGGHEWLDSLKPEVRRLSNITRSTFGSFLSQTLKFASDIYSYYATKNYMNNRD